MKQYKEMLSNKFQREITDQIMIYEKIDTPHVVLYKWADGFAYRAPYRCLSSCVTSLQDACEIIEHKLDIKSKRGEFYMFTDQLNAYSDNKIIVRQLQYEDEELLTMMKQECNSSEVELAQIMIHDIHVLGAFVEDKLVGVSSILDLWGTYDVGILVHPQYRRRGISSLLVSENAKWVQTQNKICMYRCDDFNIGSIKTAEKLGFHKEVEVIIYDLKES
ncbi:MAG: GNAT family N-acetyltransferase [Bacilli bacterium]|nr:GNAT family N-acetyltransferase [Bacilli bacterium]